MANINLMQASNQWATRPDDQRFWNVQELHAACVYNREHAIEHKTALAGLTVDAGNDGAMALVGSTGARAQLTWHAFGQLARTVGAPADYLRSLPAPLAVQNLRHGIAALPSDKEGNLLFHSNGGLVARSITSEKYGRIWNSDLTSRLLTLGEHGWKTPPARPAPGYKGETRTATEADVLQGGSGGGLKVSVGDTIAPAGLYASDHDLFAFMVNENNRLQDGSEGGLSRGFFLENSEVGNGRSARFTFFLYRGVCGNHIVWGAEKTSTVRVRHVGDSATDRYMTEVQKELRDYANQGAALQQAAIDNARTLRLGSTKDEVLNVLFAKLRGDCSQEVVAASVNRAIEDADRGDTFDPLTVWGAVQGMTAHSQTMPYAADRTKLDRAAGKVLAFAF